MKTEEKKALEVKALESPNGGISSTRVNEKRLLTFTLYYMVIFTILIIGYAFIAMIYEKDSKDIVLDLLVQVYVWSVGSLWVSTFAPKFWTKGTEMISVFSKNRNGEKK